MEIMKTKIILIVCVVCSLTMPCLAQQLAKQAVAFHSDTYGSLSLSDRFCFVLIEEGVLRSSDTVVVVDYNPLLQYVYHNIPRQIVGEEIGYLLQIAGDLQESEALIGEKDGYTIVLWTGAYNFGQILAISKDGVSCLFRSDGSIKLIEFVDGEWSSGKQSTIEDIRKFFATTVARY